MAEEFHVCKMRTFNETHEQAVYSFILFGKDNDKYNCDPFVIT